MEGVPADKHEEILHLLHENLSLSRENNRLLLQARRIGRIAFWTKVAIWTVVLVLPVVLYSYFEPVLQKANFSPSRLLGLPSADEFQKAIDAYKGQYHP